MVDVRITAPADRSAPRLRWRRWRRYWLRDPLLGALNLLLLSLCRMLPLDWCSALGGALGVLNGRYRYHAVRQRSERLYLRIAGSDSTPADAERAVTRLFASAGRAMVEFAVLDRLWPEGRIAVTGDQHVLAARAGGNPVIVMGLHLANWEIIGPSLIGLGIDIKFIYQPPSSRFDHKIAVAARERYGATMLRPGVAAARIARRLLVEERGVLLIYADDERNGRIGAPLFDRPIPPRANLGTIVRLARASGAPVIPAYAERLDGARFRVTYLPPVELLPEHNDRHAVLAENVHRLDRVITPLVLAHLDAWYMLLEAREA